MARIGVLYDKDIRERVFGVFATNSSEGRYIISLSASPSTIAVGQSTTITATLTLNGNAVQGQTVTFTIGGTTVGTGTTNANGQATYTYQSTVVGTVSIAGTSNNVRSVTSIIVNKISTTTSISASSQSITVSDSVTLSGSVTGATTGTVKIYDGNTFISDVSLSNGSYTKTLSNLSGGTHTYKAVYQADSTHSSSQSSTIIVTVHDYSLTLTGTSIIQNGSSTSVTATLKDNNVAVNNASLSYQIKHGSTIINSGTTTTNSSGNSTISYTGTGVGEVLVIVSYSSLLQETYCLKDVTFYDTGIYGTNNDKYYKSSTTTYEPLSDGTRLTGSSVSMLMATESTSSWNKIRTFPVGTCMEFDIVEAQNMMLLIYYDNNGTDTNTIANTNFIIATEEETHWKVEIKADGIYKNGTKIITANITKDISFGLQNPNANYQEDLPRMCKFKNFVIYPI